MINRAQLDSLTQFLGKDDINQIRLQYTQDSCLKVSLLLSAWRERDYQELQRLSHSLKSSSLNMAMQMFAKQCQQIEKLAPLHDDQGLQAIIDTLPALHQVSLKELAAYFASSD
ncbi:Hpt domain-containing protein [Marinomonas profundimaris]|uniref:Histidine kinase n=1 Tax=Marinomonas profundimaris TaxID=1208321 RepID=W1RY10_9GAMM|nr:Hpt domain-containing protein [Marinomonas profundimaris]ETI59718.1 histidine kinase [Marinomonas profundimaris]